MKRPFAILTTVIVGAVVFQLAVAATTRAQPPDEKILNAIPRGNSTVEPLNAQRSYSEIVSQDSREVQSAVHMLNLSQPPKVGTQEVRDWRAGVHLLAKVEPLQGENVLCRNVTWRASETEADFAWQDYPCAMALHAHGLEGVPVILRYLRFRPVWVKGGPDERISPSPEAMKLFARIVLAAYHEYDGTIADPEALAIETVEKVATDKPHENLDLLLAQMKALRTPPKKDRKPAD